MKIGVTAEALNKNGAGIRTYTYNLIKCLNEYSSHQLYLLEYENDNVFPKLPRIIIPNPLSKISNLYLWHPYLTKKLNDGNYDLDIVHSLNQGPSFLRLKKQKYVITIHDILPLVYPRLRPLKVYLTYKALLKKTLQNADMVIASSYSTKEDIIRIIKIPAEKIRVVHLGVENRFNPAGSAEDCARIAKYGINSNYILYVGGLAAHKNIPCLIKSFYLLKTKGHTHKLVIAGTKRWKYEDIFSLVEKLGLAHDVVFTGYLPDEDLPSLYRKADLFVNPSLYEGFGLPTLEAMACGLPVVTSNTSSFPEVTGSAGAMVDPSNDHQLARQMHRILIDEELSRKLTQLGLERAKVFSWKRCAKGTLDVYDEVQAS